MGTPSGTANTGTGTTVSFATSTIAGNVTSVGWAGPTRESVPTSHLGTTGGMTFIPGDLYDPGELSLDIQFDGAVNAEALVVAAAEAITVTWAGGNDNWVATGFITSFDETAPLEDLMTGTITVKFSGAIVTNTS